MSDPLRERPLSGAASGDLPDSPLLPDPHVGHSPARKTEGSARAWALDNERAPRKFLRLAEITAIFRISFPKPTLRADAAQDRACMVRIEPAKSRLEPVRERPAVARVPVPRTRGFGDVRLQANRSRSRAADRLRCASEPIGATLPNGSPLLGAQAGLYSESVCQPGGRR